MVNRATRTWLLTISVVGMVSSGLSKELAAYSLGDQVTEDIITPVPLMVVDPIATRALKAKEENRIPVIFRYNESALAMVEADLRATFSEARSNFLALLEQSFQRPRLNAREMETEQFRRVIDGFKLRNKAFPLSDEMAREWAGGNVVLPEQIALSARVHRAMEGLIRYDNLTNTPKLGSQVLLVPVKSESETISLEDVTARGYNEMRTNLLTMSRARLALSERFSNGEVDMARFATRRLRENCFVESDLTRAARARHTDPLFVADNYQAGQMIARKDQLVDEKIMAALSQLQEKTAAGRLAEQVVHEREKAEREQAQAAQFRENNKWLTVGLVASGAALVLVLLGMVLRRRREPAMFPLVLSGTTSVPSLGAPGEGGAVSLSVDAWQQRALAAEQRADRAHAAIRAGVLAHLKQKLFGSLVSQRGQMIEAQRSAAAEMAELERRLNELHAPLQERLRVYEARIADLEQALAAKGEESRELIRAKIEMMRKQLAVERSRKHLEFN